MNKINHNSKYENIPFGYFNELTNKLTSMENKKITYRNYTIEPGGLGYTYVHNDYEGVTFIGEDIESADERAGSCRTIEECKIEIDEKERERLINRCEQASFVVDDELGKLTYYYRFVYDCPNPQTDVEERLLKIELVEDEHGNEVKLDSWQYQTACETILYKHAKTW